MCRSWGWAPHLQLLHGGRLSRIRAVQPALQPIPASTQPGEGGGCSTNQPATSSLMRLEAEWGACCCRAGALHTCTIQRGPRSLRLHRPALAAAWPLPAGLAGLLLYCGSQLL
jgi:hypothetical protein